jgi:hypothetical protein
VYVSVCVSVAVSVCVGVVTVCCMVLLLCEQHPGRAHPDPAWGHCDSARF